MAWPPQRTRMPQQTKSHTRRALYNKQTVLVRMYDSMFGCWVGKHAITYEVRYTVEVFLSSLPVHPRGKSRILTVMLRMLAHGQKSEQLTRTFCSIISRSRRWCLGDTTLDVPSVTSPYKSTRGHPISAEYESAVWRFTRIAATTILQCG